MDPVAVERLVLSSSMIISISGIPWKVQMVLVLLLDITSSFDILLSFCGI